MFKSLMISELLIFLFLIDENTQKELESMINLFELLVETMLSVSSIAQVSAVSIEASFEKAFFACLILECIFTSTSVLYKCGSSYGIFGDAGRFL